MRHRKNKIGRALRPPDAPFYARDLKSPPAGPIAGQVLTMSDAPHSRPPRPYAPGPQKPGGPSRVRRWLARLGLMRPRSRRDEVERRFGVLFERSGEGLLICGPQGQILACNPVAARLLGTSAQAVLGGPVLGHVVQEVAPDQKPRLRSGEGHVRRPDGTLVPVEIRLSELSAEPDPQGLVQLRDLSDRRQVMQLANYDSLTGLPNRSLFRERLARAMERVRASGRPLALMFLDLDRFKVINDSLGHEAGDRLLQHVALTLSGCLRGGDAVARAVDDDPFTVSRLGGDEFTVIAEGIHGPDDAAAIAQRLIDALAAPFKVGDEEIVVSTSIGITTYPTDDVDLDTLVRHTDMAMYRAKSLGKGMYCFYSEDLDAAVTARLSLEGSLRRAIEHQEFALYYQPKANLRTGEVTGVEALLRWHAPGRGMVPPDRFIAVLEETGLIVQVGAWVMRKAIAQLAAWDRAGLPGLRLAVNLSARQMRHPQLGTLIADTLRQCEIDPSRLEVELTESLLMEDNEATRAMLSTFKRLGVRLALDDFGTGHSSLAYLRRFHLHTLKIDRSFVSALPNNVEDMAISRAIIALGRSMNMAVVAEGVETEAQALALHEMGCDEMQGYLLARPMAGEELPHWLQQRAAYTEMSRLAHLDDEGVTRLDIMLDGGEIWIGTESPALEVWRAKRFVESMHASLGEPAQSAVVEAAARPEPRAAGGGDAAAATGADPGRRRLGQDAGADDAHRVAAGARVGEPGADLRGDLHQQGRQGDADAPVDHAAGERSRDVDRDLSRTGEPLPAGALEAGRAAPKFSDP